MDKEVNRFELEQQIIACWGIVDDLKSRDLPQDVVINFYDARFNRLFNTFEKMVKAGKIT